MQCNCAEGLHFSLSLALHTIPLLVPPAKRAYHCYFVSSQSQETNGRTAGEAEASGIKWRCTWREGGREGGRGVE